MIRVLYFEDPDHENPPFLRVRANRQVGLLERSLFYSDLLVDTPDWSHSNNSCSELTVEFAYFWEETFALTLDRRGILWQYKPRTFAVEWDDEGNFVDSFTPDFYLPLIDLYVELIGPQRHETSAKARKVRLLRQQAPELRIELLSVDSSADYRVYADKISNQMEIRI